MGLFNVVTTTKRDGRPYGFNVEVRGLESVDDVFAALMRDGILRCDRLIAGSTPGVRERVPMVLGKDMVGQISLATATGAGTRNLHAAPRLARQLPEKRIISVVAR